MIQKKKIYKVIKKNFGEKAQKGVIIFDDSDLDKGLLSAGNVKILEELKLPLPSKIKNKKLEDIRIYQKNAEVHLDYFKTLLKNKAFFYTEKGSSKAKELSENPRKDTLKQVKIYNV